jgi:hypothetical protein
MILIRQNIDIPFFRSLSGLKEGLEGIILRQTGIAPLLRSVIASRIGVIIPQFLN